jgi:hypothetical protein
MYLSELPSFDDVLATLEDLEHRINMRPQNLQENP